MPGERLSMRKIREVLRLRFAQGLSQRAIGISLRLSTGASNIAGSWSVDNLDSTSWNGRDKPTNHPLWHLAGCRSVKKETSGFPGRDDRNGDTATLSLHVAAGQGI
jgi:hypothetical protein